ncbi:hypothetical protein ACFL04_02230 [Patescibacteria group bacterium]
MNRNTLIVWTVAGVFFILTSWPGIYHAGGYTSPDEEINYIAAESFSENGNFLLGNALAEDDLGTVKPRNAQIVNNYIVPLSFLGFPLIMGITAKIFGSWIISLITPLIVSFGLVAFYFLVKSYWGEFIGLVGFILLTIFPGLLFFTYKGLWHNAVFISLLIISFFMAVIYKKKESWWVIIVAGGFFGLAITIRTSELVWLIPLMILWLTIALRNINLKKIFTFIIITIVFTLPILYFNSQTFGGPLSFGYTAALEREGSIVSETSTFTRAVNLLIPSDNKLSNYIDNGQRYIVEFSPLYFLLIMLGLLSLIVKKINQQLKIWLIIMFLVSVWLFWYYAGTIYYGGTTTADGPIIGSSYIRYFLPMTVLVMPIAASGIKWIIDLYRGKTRQLLLAAIITILLISSVHILLFDSQSGLIKYFNEDIPQINEASESVINLTETDAIIIAGAKDKLFFPERSVIGYNDISDKHLKTISKLIGEYDLYYNDIAERDLTTLSELAADNNYSLKSVGNIGQDILYKFVKN